MKSFATLLLCCLPSLGYAVQLCWDAPTENVDGTPLTDLAGYMVYWGPTSRTYDQSVGIDDPTLTCAEVPLGAPGDYFVAMTAFDADGNESAYSNEVVKTQAATDPLPEAPSNVALVDDPAYIIVQSNDTLVLLDVGRMNAQTTCDINVAIRDDNGILAYKVPVSSVTPYSPGQEMVVVFSRCGN